MNQIELLEMRLAGVRLEMTKINKIDQDYQDCRMSQCGVPKGNTFHGRAIGPESHLPHTNASSQQKTRSDCQDG